MQCNYVTMLLVRDLDKDGTMLFAFKFFVVTLFQNIEDLIWINKQYPYQLMTKKSRVQILRSTNSSNI